MSQQGLAQEVEPVHHQHLHLTKQQVQILHVDVFEVLVHSLVDIFDGEEHVADVEDE